MNDPEKILDKFICNTDNHRFKQVGPRPIDNITEPYWQCYLCGIWYYSDNVTMSNGKYTSHKGYYWKNDKWNRVGIN